MFEQFGWQHIALIAQGAVMTIVVCLVSGVLGALLALVLGAAASSGNRVLRAISKTYINIIRGIPLLVIIFFVYFGLPLLFPRMNTTAFISAAGALTLYAAAYLGEIVRGGLEAVPKGQHEAAESLGMSYFSRMTNVVIPQAMRLIIPPGIGFLIALVKDSSLVSVVGLVELTKSGRVVSSVTTDPLLSFSVVALFYFIICAVMSFVSNWYEKRISAGMKRQAIRVNPSKIIKAAHS